MVLAGRSTRGKFTGFGGTFGGRGGRGIEGDMFCGGREEIVDTIFVKMGGRN